MNLSEYLKENPNSSVKTLENLFSVGCVIDTVNGNTFPMMSDSSIGFDEPMNVMDMDFNDDSYDWFEALSDNDKSAVDEVVVNLSYEEWVESHIGEPEYLGGR